MMVKVRVRARVKNRSFPKTWGRVDFRGEPETEVEVPEEVLKILKADGWLMEPSIVPGPPAPVPPPLALPFVPPVDVPVPEES